LIDPLLQREEFGSLGEAFKSASTRLERAVSMPPVSHNFIVLTFQLRHR
jgi:hypothetical protein